MRLGLQSEKKNKQGKEKEEKRRSNKQKLSKTLSYLFATMAIICSLLQADKQSGYI